MRAVARLALCALLILTTSAQDPPKVAVCFWGVNRSLNRTLASIERHVFKPLEDDGFEIDVFFHTYTMKRVTSPWAPWAKEFNAAPDGPLQEVTLLENRVTQWAAGNQQLFDDRFPWHGLVEFMKGGGRGRKHGLQIVKNVVRALHSLKEVTALWESETKARRNPMDPDEFRKAHGTRQRERFCDLRKTGPEFPVAPRPLPPQDLVVDPALHAAVGLLDGRRQ